MPGMLSVWVAPAQRVSRVCKITNHEFRIFMKLPTFTPYYRVMLVYDSYQVNQFNRDKMWKCIKSITMNRYNLKISIISIMSLTTYESTQSTHRKNSNESDQSTQYTCMVCICMYSHRGAHPHNPAAIPRPECWSFLETLRFRWLFLKTFHFVDLFRISWINWIDSTIPDAQTQLTQSTSLWKRIDSITNQLSWKRNWINLINFAEKMNRFKSINSIDLIGIQVWL